MKVDDLPGKPGVPHQETPGSQRSCYLGNLWEELVIWRYFGDDTLFVTIKVMVRLAGEV